MAFRTQTRPDTVVGNYRIIERIASGGMGVVYKALDLSLQRTVALKFVSPDRPDPLERDRLLREARATSALDHENIAAVHAVGEADDGQLFIVMSYYQGEDLAARMARSPLTTEESVEIVAQIARGLAHAHAHNIVHRDIKPSNVILTNEGIAKIVDFGLARFVSPDASTLTLNFAGTLAYMSPEQLSGKALDARTDIWSLGVLMYELLGKRQPFRGDSTASLLNSILRCDPEEMMGVPPELEKIVARALEKEVENRYQSCLELLADLEEFRAVSDSKTEGNRHLRFPVSKYTSRRKWWRLSSVRWMATIAAVLLAAVLYPPAVNDVPKAPRTVAGAPAPNELYQQGLSLLDSYYKPESLNGAIQKFEQTTKADPNFALAYAALGEAYVDKYRQDLNPDWFKRAEEYCQTAIRLNSQLAEVNVTLGRIHNLLGKHDLGLQEIQHALKLDPINVKGLLALGDAYASVSRDDEAEQAYLKAIALRPDNWDAYQRHGSFYFQKAKYLEAAEQYRRLIQLRPDQAGAHSNLSAALVYLGQTGEAEKELKEALRIGPTYAAYYNLAYFYYTQSRFREAAKMAENASALNSDDYRVWQMLGICYEWIGQPGKAKEAYGRELKTLQNAERLNAEDPKAQAELGLLYSKVQQHDEAVAHLRTALAIAPTDPAVLAMAGEAYENFGDRKQALSYIESAIQHGWDTERLKRNPDLQKFLNDPEVQKRLVAVKGSNTK